MIVHYKDITAGNNGTACGRNLPEHHAESRLTTVRVRTTCKACKNTQEARVRGADNKVVSNG